MPACSTKIPYYVVAGEANARLKTGVGRVEAHSR